MKKYVLLLGMIAMISSLVVAQQQISMRNGNGPREKGDKISKMTERLELTKEQSEQFENLLVAHHQVVYPVQNKLKEKKATLRTLTTANEIDNKKIDKTINEISDLEKTLLKAKINNQIAIRSMLNDKQKMIFDKSRSEMKKGGGDRQMQKSGRG